MYARALSVGFAFVFERVRVHQIPILELVKKVMSRCSYLANIPEHGRRIAAAEALGVLRTPAEPLRGDRRGAPEAAGAKLPVPPVQIQLQGIYHMFMKTPTESSHDFLAHYHPRYELSRAHACMCMAHE